MRPTAEERFWSRVKKRHGRNPCWNWTGTKDRHGYGQLSVNGRKVLAHRFAYELLVGPIPAGMELDHVRARGCRFVDCVNPAHLEPVTHRINVLRGRGPTALHAQKVTCPRCGERLTVKPWKPSVRYCRPCHLASQKSYHSQWRSDHRERLRVYSAAWRRRQKKKPRMYGRAWRQRHLMEDRARNLAYYYANRDGINARKRAARRVRRALTGAPLADIPETG
jgi:hypothetical protein